MHIRSFIAKIFAFAGREKIENELAKKVSAHLAFLEEQFIHQGLGMALCAASRT
jgi:hypothetical protein